MEIKFDNVSFKSVIKNVNMKIEEGMIIGITGASGSGKTMLLEMIDGLILPTSGKITVGDIIITKNKKIKKINDLRFDVGLVFENTEEQFFNTTVKDEIEFATKFFNYKKDISSDRVKDALKMVGLNESYLEQDPFTLSAGEMKKVALASILIYNPKIILLDEPTNALDGKSKRNLIRIIRTLKTRYNKTIVIATQDTDMLHKIVDYIYVINDGSIVMEGNKFDVFKEEDKLKSYGVRTPRIIEFSNMVLKDKNIKLGYRDDINDLIKDIYRYVK